MHPHAPSQWRINIHRFQSFLLLFFRRHRTDGAHVVQSIRQFNQSHSNIFRCGHDELAEIFCLLVHSGGELQIGELGHPINQFSHLTAEQVL